MKILGKVHLDTRHQRRTLQVILFMSMVMIATACIAPDALLDQPSVTQPASPLIPDANPALAESRWRMVEVISRGELVAFDAVGSIYISFELGGYLSIFADCPGGAYQLISLSVRHYRLTRGEFAAVECGDLIRTQFTRVRDALEATTEYEIQDNELFLTGEDVRIVLEINNPR